jgi:hypothetical protein
LERFNPEIEAYVKNSQYSLQKFEVDLYPPKTRFLLEKGQQFAYSGNTGRSGGPHLHFEIRMTNGEIPLNVLTYGLPVEDDLPPVFRTLFIYGFPEDKVTGNNGEERTACSVKKLTDTTFVIPTTITTDYLFCGFAAEVYDYLNGSSNRCGVYSLEFSVNDDPVFSFFIDSISFLKTRYINAHMDYELKIHENRSVHRLFMLPNNNLPIYHKAGHTTLFRLDPDSVYHGKIIASDAYGNTSQLEFDFKSGNEISPEGKDKNNLVRWNEGKNFVMDKCQVNIPAYVLYRDIYFDYDELPSDSALSDTIRIHHEDEPLHRNITVKLTPAIVEGYKAKMVLARIEEGEISYEESEWQNDKLVAYTRKFGKYFVTLDTVPPEIVPDQFTADEHYFNGQKLSFKVTDDLSGIKTYNAFIDNKWVLLEYDAKSDTMFYILDEDRLVQGMHHSLKLHVMDFKNNIAIFESGFYY